MNSLSIWTVFSVIVSTSLAFDKNFRCGDDWFAFRDEKCFRVVNRSLTRDEATTACGGVKRTSYMSSIATIKSKSEQKFIENYLFNKLGFEENVWIGAKRDNNQSFEWEDGSKIYYKNWADGKPSDEPDSNCVQMKARNGKWIDLSCDSTGIVICEKLQIWTFPELLNSYFDWRRHLEHQNEELSEELLEKDLKIRALEKSLDGINRRISSFGTQLDRLGQEFDRRLNNTFEVINEQNDRTQRRITNLEKKTDNIVDGMLALHEECSNGCSGSDDGPSDGELENIKKEIIKEIEEKLKPIENKVENSVTDARLQIISYRRTLQIEKKGKWISLGHV